MKIVEGYKTFRPPFDAAALVARLIDGLPARCGSGLHAIVLTDTASLSRSQRRGRAWSGQKKYHVGHVLGVYHPAWNGEPPWIELFMDKILAGQRLLTLPIIRELVVSRVLFHELGHHIHYTQEPMHRDREAIADQWQRRLGRRFFRTRYRLLFPLLLLLGRAESWFRRRAA